MIARLLLYTFVALSGCSKNLPGNSNMAAGSSYYFSASGDDKNDGSLRHPFQSISFLNNLNLHHGDSVFLKAGDVFNGTIVIKENIQGTAERPVVITSYGNGSAIINAQNAMGLLVNQSSFINIQNIKFKGSGRKDGNTTNGISIDQSSNINITHAEVNGFQKAGLLVYKSHDINVINVYAYDNGFAGISISGENKKDDCSNIHINQCKAENNPGDPTNFGNHSGNGIIAGFCKNVLIEYCTATNNGWDMPRVGNGPVGIWCYEADSVTIQHCISYRNKTSKGGEDGGGYDLDGGTTNSIIQYCLSYENQGSAFGIFQYAGGSAWHDNTIRFCISENDGNVSAAHANAYVWNSSHDSSQFKNFLFYNNTIYNDSNAAVSYSVESDHTNFKFYNNIFIAAHEIIKGNFSNDDFLANDWWSLQNHFNVDNHYDFISWCLDNNKEQVKGEIKGLNMLPLFKNADHSTLTDADKLNAFDNYSIINLSLVSAAGIDLLSLFNINSGNRDFQGSILNKNCIGACSGN